MREAKPTLLFLFQVYLRIFMSRSNVRKRPYATAILKQYAKHIRIFFKKTGHVLFMVFPARNLPTSSSFDENLRLLRVVSKAQYFQECFRTKFVNG